MVQQGKRKHKKTGKNGPKRSKMVNNGQKQLMLSKTVNISRQRSKSVNMVKKVNNNLKRSKTVKKGEKKNKNKSLIRETLNLSTNVVLLKSLFAPTFQSPMSTNFRDSEKKKIKLKSVKLPRKKKVFKSNFWLYK